MAPNELASLALQSWPLVALAVFAMRRSSARVARTTAWMLLLPVMFLPPNMELPFAGLNKHRIAILSVATALALFHRREAVSRDRWRHFPLFALLLFAGGAWQTIQTNSDPLSFGVLRLPALGQRDLAWTIYGFVVDLYLPFVIGQRVFRTERDLRDLLGVLSTCVLIYAPLCLVEMRLSPQLSLWVYGYHPHQFLQAMRGSGYRPVVFMNHGLSVAMFLFSGLCAAITLHQARDGGRPSPRMRAMSVGALLLLGRSLASIIYSGVALLAALWPSTRARARIAALIGILVVAYPALRASDLVPTDDIGDLFAGLSRERTSSLMTRFNQENDLLARAMQRPLFGWGGWGRSRIYYWWGEPGDDWAGYKDTSITDGTWIIWLGATGLVGFAASFAVLVVPLLRYARRCPALERTQQVLGSGLAVMLGIFTADLLPNSMSDLLPVVYAGALFSLSSAQPRVVGRPAPRRETQVDPSRAPTAAAHGAGG